MSSQIVVRFEPKINELARKVAEARARISVILCGERLRWSLLGFFSSARRKRRL